MSETPPPNNEPAPPPTPAPAPPPPPSKLQLPHTANCLVCGRNNPHGLHLDLFVMTGTGLVVAEFVPQHSHAGFEGIAHGGILSTVMDEAMTWAATWNIKRFCLCGELNVRFRQSVYIGQRVRVEAHVDFSRHKLVEPSAKLFDEFHKLLATATGKYVPVSPDQHGQFVKTFIESDRTLEAAKLLGLRNVPVSELTE